MMDAADNGSALNGAEMSQNPSETRSQPQPQSQPEHKACPGEEVWERSRCGRSYKKGAQTSMPTDEKQESVSLKKRDQMSPKRREQVEKSPRKSKTHRKVGHRQAHFLHGPSPDIHFGPKASILQNATSIMHIQDPTSQRLTWDKPPTNVLVIKKVKDEALLEPFKELCTFLIEQCEVLPKWLWEPVSFQTYKSMLRTGVRVWILWWLNSIVWSCKLCYRGQIVFDVEKHLIVFVEKKVVDDAALAKDVKFEPIRQQLSPFREGYDELSGYIDLIICLGGDGTLLYASSLFQTSVPPVMAFHLGSLGFLTPFKFESYRKEVTNVIEGDARIILRSRLKVKVVKELKTTEVERQYQVQDNGLAPQSHIDNEAGKVFMQVLHVLNEVVVDRGPSSYLSNVDLYLDGRLITSVQGDGVIVSTPTGSTAYAAAAGASMMHPNVPAIMITPICPHSLSFRPIVVPAGMELKIMLSPDTRNAAWVSFDGRRRQEIQHTDSITVTTSCYPVPSICCHDLVYDWFESLAECLHWNVRKKQSRFEEITDSSDTEC
ncbi:NAD kinase-like isoform X1 [Chiloscyllium plagiosum]|uniref:NAD kinase-like isoform X1 n=1 Tax=Chiloscyllium plagiosum TaxID=36176 RepID=UPI001CB7D5FF|nr:NAD kinase-like isoform X1 [Chiloscyllium plagiosum]XP_043558569.1 NAD kinase-like isoform X1 [Chiloscyllium plagiosum]